ncbi:MAG: hypothetical protein NZ531_00425, partial [Aquificaceae bacterium]|nr:hypothetical protein [Aquificaceae bacterium]
GRWVQRDPILDEHPYVYVDNIPTVYIDPDGTCRRIGEKWVCLIESNGSYIAIIDPNHHPPGKSSLTIIPPTKGVLVIIDHDKGASRPDVFIIPVKPGDVIFHYDSEDGKVVPISIPKPKPKPKPMPKPPEKRKDITATT